MGDFPPDRGQFRNEAGPDAMIVAPRTGFQEIDVMNWYDSSQGRVWQQAQYLAPQERGFVPQWTKKNHCR
jgi:hypothetical protein